MAGTDLIHLYDNHWAVRDMANAWVAAGSPPINSAGRLYAEQKQAWIAYQNGTGSPADNPDQPGSYELAHVRFAALDIDPTPARVAALTGQGLVRPFSYEPWHWRLPNIYNYPIVTSLPGSGAGGGSVPFEPGAGAAEMNAEEWRQFQVLATNVNDALASIRATQAAVGSLQRYVFFGDKDLPEADQVVSNTVGATESIFGVALSMKAEVDALAKAVDALPKA